MSCKQCLEKIKTEFGELSYQYVSELVSGIEETPTSRYLSVLNREQESKRSLDIERQSVCRSYHDLFKIMIEELGNSELKPKVPISFEEAKLMILLSDGYLWADTEKQITAQRKIISVIHPLLLEVQSNLGKKFYPKSITYNPKGRPKEDEINLRSMEVEAWIDSGLSITAAREKVAAESNKSLDTIRKPHKILMDRRKEAEKSAEAFWKKRGKKRGKK